MNVDSEVKLKISGVFEYRDKDGNIIKQVPFNGAIPVERIEEVKEEEDGNVRE